MNNCNAERSGTIYVVFNPGWFINDLDGLSSVVVCEFSKALES
ncbi:MAG: hypothetical protein WBO54_12360 [Thermoanaerobaculia bacterium]